MNLMPSNPAPTPRAPAHLPACMGGWCTLRQACPRYHAQSGVDPVERLCNRGRDGELLQERLLVLKEVA
jgi:hypothetical protein